MIASGGKMCLALKNGPNQRIQFARVWKKMPELMDANKKCTHTFSVELEVVGGLQKCIWEPVLIAYILHNYKNNDISKLIWYKTLWIILQREEKKEEGEI